MKFAYADPPYVGLCRLYDHYHPDGRCWDEVGTHALLFERLQAEFPDGWAVSCHSPSLRVLLPIAPVTVRVGAWVKPFASFKRGVRPAYAWEPVLFEGGRNPCRGFPHLEIPAVSGVQTTPRDYVSEPITLRRGLVGAKPEAVCRWILDMLGYQHGDELHDLFPGTGVMGRVAASVVPRATQQEFVLQ